ncbi:MAG: V-type ATP synthase subunit I [Clostridiales bacterium]|nr:V-type ATP synthase subunit I [Clostridiales bacterium]
MSIVKMNKLSVIGLETEKAVLMEELQKLGIVEINEQTEKLQDPEWLSLIQRDGDEDRVSELDHSIAEAEAVLDTIAKYDSEKKPLFRMRKEVTEKDYQNVASGGSEIPNRIQNLYTNLEEWNDLKSEENAIQTSLAALKPWMQYSMPLELEETRSVRIYRGVTPVVADDTAMMSKLAEVSEATHAVKFCEDQEQKYFCIFCMKQEEEEVLDTLKSFGFTIMNFKGMEGTPEENAKRLQERLQEVQNRQKEMENRFRIPQEEKTQIQCYYDSLQVQRDRAKISENLLKTRTSFYFDGWVPAEQQKDVEKILEERGCWYDIQVPEKGEETPVLMKNNSAIYPVQAVTELYSLPKSYEVDPTPIFAAFYVVFFGMMFADIAYGLILAGLCIFALKKYKLEGMAYRLVKTLSYCGVSTAVWGLLFGGFFGDMITIKPLWMNPLDNAMFILAFSCILGTVHLFVGMGVKAYMQIRDGKIFDAICDVFIWYVFIIGLALLLFGNSFLFQGAGTIGKYMAIIGGVWIVGCEFIRGKGVGKLLGLWNLYGTTSYLADILSYSRLLALGLASAVIAQVFNMLGRMLGTGVVGVIGFIIVAVIGHTVNFAINALGSFVHASRLQYVEFFGKFYEGGGEPFQPFERKTKYVKIVKEDK